jgi:segregation and condensation protein B
MESRDYASDANEREVVQVVAAEPVLEASVAELAEATPGYVVAAAEPRYLHTVDEPDEREDTPHKNGMLKTVLECMLFVSPEPLAAKQLAESLDVEEERVEEAMRALEQDLDGGHGLQLMRVAGGFQLCTRPEYSDYCAMILRQSTRKLSNAALETLAIVAYRQPCTMPEIEAVRGVSVDGVMKTLTDRALIKEAGRKQAPGRPILYKTTDEFLEYFGLNDISELPDIDMLAVEEVKALEAQREMLVNESPDEPGEAVDGGSSDC